MFGRHHSWSGSDHETYRCGLASTAGKRHPHLATLLLGTTAMVLSGSVQVLAATDQWTGAVSSDWFTAGNWSGGVPNASTDIDVDQGAPNPAVIDGGNAVSNSIHLGTSTGFNGVLDIRNGSTLTSNQNSFIGYFAGGTGMVTVDGNGSQWNLGANVLQIGVDGTGTLDISNGGAVTDAGAPIGVFAGSIGTVTVSSGGSWLNTVDTIVGRDGTGTLTIDGSSGGATVINNQEGFIGQNTGSTGTVTVTSGGTWTSKQDLVVGRDGTGTLTISNGGTVSQGLSGGNAYIGYGPTDSTARGTATVTGSGSSLHAANDLYVGFNGRGTLIVANNGAVVVGGTLYIAENASATGTLIIGGHPMTSPDAPGTVTAGAIVMGGKDAEIDFNHTSSNYTFSTPISSVAGEGAINQLAGVTDLTGDSSSFTGTTNIFGGTLKVNGTLDGSVLVSGGTLGGSGALNGNTTINSGGTMAPGNSIGTLAVNNITFNAGSTYTVELNDGGNTAGVNNDLIDADTVTLSGGTVHVTPENATDDGSTYADGTTYTIIDAKVGVTGTFDSVTDDYAYLDFALSYDANDVYLTSALGSPSFCLAGMSDNECAAGKGVQSLGSGTLYDAVLNLSNAEAADALDALSGELYASLRTAFIEDSRFPREAALSRVRSAFGGVAGDDVTTASQPMPGTDITVWGRGFGSWSDQDGGDDVAQIDRSIGGLILGADTSVADAVRLGALAAYSHSDFDVDGRDSSGNADSYTLGLYGGAQWDGLGLRFGGAYSWHDVDADRSVDFIGFSDSLSADYDARTGQVFGEAGYRLDLGAAGLEPFANIAYVNLDTDSFTEKGGDAALHVSGKDTDASFTTLGLRAETKLNLGETGAHLRGSAGWRHAFGDMTPDSRQAFAAGGSGFIVEGVPLAKDAAALEAGFDVSPAPGATIGLSYDGQVGTDLSDQGVRAQFDLRF